MIDVAAQLHARAQLVRRAEQLDRKPAPEPLAAETVALKLVRALLRSGQRFSRWSNPDFDAIIDTQNPKTRVPIDEETATKLMRLVDALEDNDDVNEVHANFDVDAAVLERVAG